MDNDFNIIRNRFYNKFGKDMKDLPASVQRYIATLERMYKFPSYKSRLTDLNMCIYTGDQEFDLRDQEEHFVVTTNGAENFDMIHVNNDNLVATTELQDLAKSLGFSYIAFEDDQRMFREV